MKTFEELKEIMHTSQDEMGRPNISVEEAFTILVDTVDKMRKDIKALQQFNENV